MYQIDYKKAYYSHKWILQCIDLNESLHVLIKTLISCWSTQLEMYSEKKVLTSESILMVFVKAILLALRFSVWRSITCAFCSAGNIYITRTSYSPSLHGFFQETLACPSHLPAGENIEHLVGGQDYTYLGIQMPGKLPVADVTENSSSLKSNKLKVTTSVRMCNTLQQTTSLMRHDCIFLLCTHHTTWICQIGRRKWVLQASME